MAFDTVIDQIKAVRGDTEVVIVKLGTVTALSGGKAQVKIYGDSAASNKLYQYIDGYLPAVDDKVLLVPQGKTYIILGKVTDAVPAQKWADKDHNHDGTYLPVSYKNKIEDSTDILELSSHVLLPNTDNVIGIGSSTKQISAGYFKALYADGTQVQMDRIQVTSGGTTYSLILSYASSTATLTPSSDNVFALGSSSKKFKEAWLGLFRGAWKSGQSTERQISWNSSNALVPDTDGSVDLGTSSARFKHLYLARMIGSLAYSSSSNTVIGWASATVLQPSATNSIELGASGKQFNAVYTNKLYLNGTEFSPSGLTMDTLTTKYGSTNYTLALSVKNGGSSNQFEELTPSVNNKFNLGNSSYKLQTIYLSNWHNGTRYITFDSSHNILPDTTNAVSLGTSNKQYKNIYGQNVYVNGTAVSSDRRLKEEIQPLDDKHTAFLKALRPVQFKYKDGESGRTHTGFIAQEVEEAVQESGMTDKDMAVVVKDPEDNYYLRYEEIISVQTKVIQDLMARVESLEARITKLEGKGENK